MKLLDYQKEFSQCVGTLFFYLELHGYTFTIGECQRTLAQQKLYFDAGYSKTMKSNHLRKLAIDIFIFKGDRLIQNKEELADIGNYWQSLHPLNRWGGNFKSLIDTPHFELNAP